MKRVQYLCITPELDRGGITVRLHTGSTATALSYTVLRADGSVAAAGDAAFDEGNTCFLPLDDVHPWTIEDPYLYTLRAQAVFAGGESEEVSDTFGMRKLSVSGQDILLNNKPFYMRAFIRGTVCHDHQNLLDLPEEEYYAKSMRAAKEYGFNTIRFHSRVPSAACFRAADRLGMFIHIEMRHGDEEYNNMEEMVNGIHTFVSDEHVREIVYSLMNHPSLMVYCIGNEIKHPGVNPQVRHLSELIKELDPSRLFIDTCAHGEFDRDYVEFDVQHMSYYYPFGKHQDMFENTDNLLVYGSCTELAMSETSDCPGGRGEITRSILPQRPIIAHEVCHYTALRDLDSLSAKYARAHKPEPWWIAEQRKMLEAKGMTQAFPRMYRASKAFQLMSWKLAIEAIRRSPILRGFHMLQFADTDRYENSNGVVDCFDEISGVDPAAFLRFNGDTVLLADLPVRSFFEGDTVAAPVSVSNYSQDEFGSCVFSYALENAESGDAVLSGELPDIHVDRRGLFEIVKLRLTLPPIAQALKYRLRVKLTSPGGRSVENEWALWCFPNRPQELDVSDCAFRLEGINAQSRYPAVARCPRKGKRVYVTDILDAQVFDTLAEGGNVLLLYRAPATRHVRDRDAQIGQYSFRATWERFKAVIWDRGTNYGGLVNKPAVLDGFPHDGISDLQFYHLIEDSDKMILDDFPVPVTPVFEGVDKSVRDRFDVYGAGFGLPEFQYDRTLRKFSYISELRVGAGRLLVSGLNFTGLGTQIPEVCGLFETLIRYVCSNAFAPEAEISLDDLRAYLAGNRKKGVVRERMMTQFWQLDDTPVESLQYWKDSKEYAAAADQDISAGNG